MKAKPGAKRKLRDLERTRQEILKVTFNEVFRRGFQGVSIDDIVKKTRLTKGALYHQFPTKLDLGYALVDEVIKPMTVDRWVRPLEAYENPLEGVLIQMQKLMGECDPDHLQLGCPLNNLVQEMSPLDKGFKVRLQAALDLWMDELEVHLKRGKKSGHINSNVNTRQLAQFVVMAHEGFYGMMKIFNERSTFNTLFNGMKAYFSTVSTGA